MSQNNLEQGNRRHITRAEDAASMAKQAHEQGISAEKAEALVQAAPGLGTIIEMFLQNPDAHLITAQIDQKDGTIDLEIE